MSDIIIDSVDVSKCEYFYSSCVPDYSGGNLYRNVCRNNGFYNCNKKPCAFKCIEYKKQLKSKKQECERLKKKLNPKVKNAHCVYFEGQTGLCKAKEFTKCNPVNCKLYTIDELSIIVNLQHDIEVFIRQLEKANKEVCQEKEKNAVLRQKLEQQESKRRNR